MFVAVVVGIVVGVAVAAMAVVLVGVVVRVFAAVIAAVVVAAMAVVIGGLAAPVLVATMMAAPTDTLASMQTMINEAAGEEDAKRDGDPMLSLLPAVRPPGEFRGDDSDVMASERATADDGEPGEPERRDRGEIFPGELIVGWKRLPGF